MRIDGATVESVRHVATHMRDSDIHEFMALSHAIDARELAATMVERYGNNPDTIVAFDGEDPVAVGAMLEIRPNVATLMFFATDQFEKIANPLTRFIRQRLFTQCRGHGVHRIECVSIEGYAAAHRWIKALGLKEEAVMPGYGRNAETFRQFAWVADVR